MVVLSVMLCVLNVLFGLLSVWQVRRYFREQRWGPAAWFLFLCALNGLAAGMTGATALHAVTS